MIKEFKPGRARFRATFLAQPGESHLGKIDKETGVLHDVQICMEGEARGHDVFLDADFIASLVEKGNSFSQGVKVRFGHPALCSDALGTYLGRARDFKLRAVDGPDGSPISGCFADIHLSEEAKHAPSGDLYAWTMETAEKSPDTFGQSIVFTYADLFFYDDEGQKVLASETKDFWDEVYSEDPARQVFAVLGEFLGTDFTDTPAATTGVFSADSLAAEADRLLEDHPQIMEVLTSHPDSVNQFLKRYNDALTASGKKPLALVAVDDTLEKRLANLQSAKDKRIEALKAEIKDLKNEIAPLSEDLAASRGETSVLKAERDEAVAALAESREQLEAEKERRVRLVGATLEDRASREDFEARLKAARSPEEREAIRAERDRVLSGR